MSIAYNYAFEMACRDEPRKSGILLEIIKECILAGVDININDSCALVNLIENQGKKSIEIIKLLIENGINVQANNNQALKSACYEDLADVVEILLNSGANIDIGKDSILGCANNMDVIKILVEHGADPFYNKNALFLDACENYDLKLITYLIEIGADVNIPDDNPICSIFDSKGNPKIKRLLLQNGANPNAKDINGICLLEHRIMYLDIESCKILFEFGADANMCDNIINMNYKIIGRKFGTTLSLEPIIELFRDHNLDIRDFLNELIIK